MKLPQNIIGLVSCLSLALAGQAAMVTTLDWQFSVAGNPSTPTPNGTVNTSPLGVASTTSNPSGGAAAATFSGQTVGLTYYFGQPPIQPDYGSAKGTYEMGGGQLALTLQSTAAASLNYTLTVIQFTQGSFPLDGAMTFSVAGANYGGRTTLDNSGSAGSWVQDSWSWSGVNIGAGTVSLVITPTTSGGDLWFDEVKFGITGDLVAAVPEPIYTQAMAAVGLLAMGICSWRRRKVPGTTQVG